HHHDGLPRVLGQVRQLQRNVRRSTARDANENSTGRLADPRSFCIQKTLQDIAHGGDLDKNLMFAGHAAYRFKQDPFYSNNFTPTVKQLVDRILTGD
ncbi:MAG: hypothetical protein NTX28_01040, partial [Novosphingobium sp.]|nr:hypothetical protein [Novosphingobium sp.]